MKKHTLPFILLISFFLLNKVNSQDTRAYDPVIQTIVDKVNGDTIWNDMTVLSAKQRYTTNSNTVQAANYLKNYFLSLGFDTAYFQSYTISGSSYVAPNVIAVKYGHTYPDSVIVVGAHYDVYASNAPGADDNGSGTAAVMETGRAIIGHDYKRTIKLVCFSGEEQGLYGSKAYANNAYTSGEKISAAITMDMIAYVKSGDAVNSDVYYNTNSTGLKNNYATITSLYISGFTVANATYPSSAGSDVDSFWNKGYKAIFPCEGQYSSLPSSDHCSPYMHSSSDVVGATGNSKPQAQKITQSVVATVVTIAELETFTDLNYTNSLNENFYLNISPNPVSTNAVVKYFIPENSTVKISVYDIYGKLYKTLKCFHEHSIGSPSEIILLVDDLSSGIYFLKLESTCGSVTKKFLVNK